MTHLTGDATIPTSALKHQMCMPRSNVCATTPSPPSRSREAAWISVKGGLGRQKETRAAAQSSPAACDIPPYDMLHEPAFRTGC
mmetsp:Transcript_62986/g.92360  ORF Transcript_62986/g.92360 Transcript_62986/m.92360 type:complete len:84 (+) Transcript_62986:132-383(+)|eukprot:CAMPEP_0179454048 /NCGR_PEP_ID=MMETSP0799-20121207/37913_1 /TAXON_ID=46947 /ORGANISM="Geminigera cryophila, Strain CCMP2564" /LENGTH=83 /DNA_ID=CAMNT_0021251539 /DNA_START=106 /DNA_END=357 /DNA_ORIENTATION=-